MVKALETCCLQLRGLSLAQNSLGKVEAHLGRDLGLMAASLVHLKVLDLHWNYFHGLGAYQMLTGIYENGQNEGMLSRIDLSWNRLGVVTATHGLSNPMAMLGEILEDNRRLFHLDISYNAIRADDCELLAEGLRENHTLFGFHVAGNQAQMDASGFLVPFREEYAGPDRPPPAPPVPPTPRSAATNPAQILAASGGTLSGTGGGPIPAVRQLPKGIAVPDLSRCTEINMDTLSYTVPEENLPEGRTAQPHILYAGSSKKNSQSMTTNDMRRASRKRNTGVGQRLPGLPGFAGLDDDLDSEHVVYMGEGVGTKSHPLDRARLKAEHCWICDRWREALITWTPGVSGSTPDFEVTSVFAFVSTDGFHLPTALERREEEEGSERRMLVRWEGYRMLPPEQRSMPPLVVFQVNGEIDFAQDMPVRELDQPAEAKLVPWENQDGEGTTPEPTSAKFTYANEIFPTSGAGLFSSEGHMGPPLVISEHHVEHGKLNVQPRQVIGKFERKEVQWAKAASVWASWREEDDSILERMLDFDMQVSKVPKFLGEDITLAQVKKAIMPFYASIVTAYRSMATQGTAQHSIFGVQVSLLVALLGRAPGVFEDFGGGITAKDVGNYAISSNVIDRKMLGEIRIRNENLLIRYQFLETIVRIAEAKYVRTKQILGLPDAITALFHELRPVMDEQRVAELKFRKAFFTEEVDLVFKNHVDMLHAVFDLYADSYLRMSGLQALTLQGWCDFLSDCDAHDECFPKRKGPLAFVMGMVFQIDEVTSERHMQMNFIEFLVALGAAVSCREFYHAEEFADLCEEFFEDVVAPLLEEKSPKDRRLQRRASRVAASIPILESKKAFFEIFRSCDEDNDQYLTTREFRGIFRDPRTQSLLGRPVKADEFMHLFEGVDTDHDGVISWEEAVTGLQNIWKLETTKGRAKAFFTMALGQEDTRGDGLTRAEFLQFSERPAAKRKFMRLMVDPNEVPTLLDTIEPTNGKYSIDALITGLMKLRSPRPVARWKILLKQVFQVADSDGNGLLSKEEFKRTFRRPEVLDKFERMGLRPTFFDGLFEILDSDRTGDLTEEELSHGFIQMWEGNMTHDEEHFRRATMARMSRATPTGSSPVSPRPPKGGERSSPPTPQSSGHKLTPLRQRLSPDSVKNRATSPRIR